MVQEVGLPIKATTGVVGLCRARDPKISQIRRPHHWWPKNSSHNSNEKQKEEKTMRKQPNIIITGTPGVGKTVHSEQIAQDTGLN